MFSYEVFLTFFPWGLNLLSLTCAFCLSNGKIIFGRYIGAIAAIGWSSYGFLIEEYSFLVANIIFLFIYASAIVKFNLKRDEYKATFEEQEITIKRLHKELNLRVKKEDRILNSKKEKLRKISTRIKEMAKENLKNIESLEESLNNDEFIQDKKV